MALTLPARSSPPPQDAAPCGCPSPSNAWAPAQPTSSSPSPTKALPHSPAIDASSSTSTTTPRTHESTIYPDRSLVEAAISIHLHVAGMIQRNLTEVIDEHDVAVFIAD